MKRTFSFEDVFFVVLLMVATIGFLWIVSGFLEAVFWAALLASLFHGVHQRLMVRLNGRASLSAMLVLLAILLIVILPLFFVGIALTRETLLLVQRVTSGEIDLNAPMQWSAKAMPMVNDLLTRVGIDPGNVSQWLSSAAVTTSRFLASRALSIGQNTLSITVQFFLMMYLVFFFVRDGTALLERLIQVIPLGDQRERRLFRKFAEVSRATLKGTVVVAILQGTLGGVALAVVGIEGAVFWGVVMTILSVLPAVGTSLVWLPSAAWLFATGATMQAVALLVMGVLIGFIDNFLRPVLVGRDTKMPDYLILLSTLGGITAFGLSGFVIGPIIAALCVAGWDMFAADFGETEPESSRACRVIVPVATIAIAGFSDPVSSLTHLTGAVAFAVAGALLIARGRGNALRVVALAVYVVGVVFALAMSGVFHLLEPDGIARAVLRRLDHAGIFFLIAATYTPIHVIQFRGLMRWGVLGFVWTCAVTGIVFKAVFFDRIPEWVGLTLYLGLGWVGIVSLLALRRSYGWPPLAPLVWGALAYTAGAILEFARWPVPIPGIVGPHELFHLFVLGGVSWHFLYIWRLLPVKEGC